MSDPPEHLDTGVYEREARRRDPVAKWIRDNVTLRGAVTVVGAVLTGVTIVITAYLSGVSHISNLEKSVATLNTSVAKMSETVERLDKSNAVYAVKLDGIEDRFNRFDDAVEKPDKRLHPRRR